MSTYESVCEELDTLTIAYFDKVHEYSQQWNQTGESLQKGFVDLAHAKYTMGPRTISRFSYDERMKALLQVELDQEFTIKKLDTAQETISEKEGLKKRSKSAEEWDEKEELKKTTKKKTSGDPLFWFGLFVSSSLRQSQGHFKIATEQLISQVNRVRELQEMEKRYQDLQQEKIAFQLEKTSLSE